MLENYYRIALIADAHGHVNLLTRALDACRKDKVDALIFLGDLIDRSDQADACVDALNGWRAYGVYGNHEKEIIAALAKGADLNLHPQTIQFFSALQDRLVIGDACCVHDELVGATQDPAQNFFRPAPPLARWDARIVFVGHTHHRAAVSDSGPVDIGRGILALNSHRRYVVNPGALFNGQFAIWDRAESVVNFKQV